MFAPQYPEVNFIVAHLGSFTDNWRAHEQMIHQLERYLNVYAGTSGVRQFDSLVRAVRVAGTRKVLFGSDGPWFNPGLELHKIRLLGLCAKEEALVLGGNALRLLRHAGRVRGRLARTLPATRIPGNSLARFLTVPDRGVGENGNGSADADPEYKV